MTVFVALLVNVPLVPYAACSVGHCMDWVSVHVQGPCPQVSVDGRSGSWLSSMSAVAFTCAATHVIGTVSLTGLPSTVTVAVLSASSEPVAAV